MKYHVVTYGCQMNKSDSERIAAVLENIGYKKASKIEEADLIVVNMCSVRQSAVDRVYGLTPKFKKLKTTSLKLQIVLTGCILKQDKKKFAQYFDYILDIKDLPNWPKYLSLILHDHGELTTKDYLKIEPKNSSFPLTYVPISNGCNNSCTYCAVPYTRGPEKYRPQKEIICEVKHLIKKGYKEITLIGQNVNSYPNFLKLLQVITALPGDFKIKFITNHPKDFSSELIKEIAENPKIAKYVHLPVQSGDNEVLRRMNRQYTMEQYLALVEKIKKQIPDVEMTTDVIVGFPGETEKQFQNTIDLFKQIEFKTAYIAKYSPRPGTAAFKLKDSIPLEEKKRREQILRNLISPTRHSEAKPKNLKYGDPSAYCRSPQGDNNRVVVVLGPTAAGKTALSVKLAKKFNGEVISADSRQVYQGMDIGTGKITKKEMQGISHYLLDVVSPKRRFSVAQYQKLAISAINKTLKKKKVPFLVGGSPFYIYSVVEGWEFPKLPADVKLRKELEKKSTEELFHILKKLDPARAKSIEKKNKRRLIRAIEIAEILGKVPPLQKNPQFDCLLIGIKKPKEELRTLIGKRLLKRFKQGMIQEVKKLRQSGISWQRLEDFGLEYRWLSRYLQEKIDYKAMVENLQKDIEKFAKRQLTWFKRDERIHWLKNYRQAEKLVKDFLK